MLFYEKNNITCQFDYLTVKVIRLQGAVFNRFQEFLQSSSFCL